MVVVLVNKVMLNIDKVIKYVEECKNKGVLNLSCQTGNLYSFITLLSVLICAISCCLKLELFLNEKSSVNNTMLVLDDFKDKDSVMIIANFHKRISVGPSNMIQSKPYPEKSSLNNRGSDVSLSEYEALKALHQAEEMYHKGKLIKAKKLYHHALSLYPTHPDILCSYGEFLENSQEILKAEQYYKKVLLISPSHRKALTNRERTLPLVEKMDQNTFDRIEFKQRMLYEVPPNHPGLQRMMKESYYSHIYHTAAIEGNTFTLSQTRSLIETRLAIGGKSLLEHNEIIGMDAALSFINNTLLQRIGKITVQDILDIHRRVLGFVDIEEAGKFRNTQVYVGNWVPPPASDVNVFMEEFVDWLNADESMKLHAIEFAALAHYKFVVIHPFYDGNGRTGRLLMNLILMQAGYPPVIIKVEEKHEYYEKIELGNKGDIRPFIRFIATCTERTLNEYLLSSTEASIMEISGFVDDGQTILINDKIFS